MLRILTGIEADANGNALHDLDVVAGGVVGRQQAESRARRRGEAFDFSVERLAAVRVGANGHTLAGTNVLDLRLLEIGRDPHPLEWDQRHQRLTRLNQLTDFDALLADRSLDRSLDGRVLEIEF